MARPIPTYTADGDGFRFRAGRLCLDLTSTVRRRHVGPIEQLGCPADLTSWLAGAGVSPVPGAVTEGELLRARELREAIYRLAHARIAGNELPSPDLDVVNAAAGVPVPVPQLTADAGVRWISDAPGAAGLAAVARDCIDLIGGPLAGRIRECLAEDCAYLFLDASRSGQRRWCAMNRCGNRSHVREFRARRRPRLTYP